MVRNLLCHMRNAPLTPTPFFQIRSASGRHICLCSICYRSAATFEMLSLLPRPCVLRFAIERHVQTTSKCSTSFGGRLAQIRAIQAWNSERRAWSSAEEFCRSDAPRQAQSINALPLPARFCAGRGRGEWGSSPKASALLHLTVFKINCNGRES